VHCDRTWCGETWGWRSSRPGAGGALSKTDALAAIVVGDLRRLGVDAGARHLISVAPDAKEKDEEGRPRPPA